MKHQSKAADSDGTAEGLLPMPDKSCYVRFNLESLELGNTASGQE